MNMKTEIGLFCRRTMNVWGSQKLKEGCSPKSFGEHIIANMFILGCKSSKL